MIQIVKQPIDEAALLESVRDPRCGAVVLFVGTTRQFTAGQETRKLVYECFETMASKELGRLRDEALERWPIVHCAIVHRVGTVPLSESSIAVAVSSPHRPEAFQAAQWLMDQIKKSVPIWKQEHGPDGTQQWIHPGVETEKQAATAASVAPSGDRSLSDSDSPANSPPTTGRSPSP